MGCANRSVRLRFVDGEARPVGYLSQWRAHPRIRRGMGLARYVARAFALFRELHEDRRTPFYLMSVVAGNHPARRLLASGLPGFPRLHPWAELATHALHLGRPRRPLPLPRGLCLARGSVERLPAILDCLQRNGRRRQLAPCWIEETLCQPEHTPGLAAEDFFVALDGAQESERVVGCLAAWDQGSVKQTVVRGYSGALARWRGPLNWLNRAARLGGWPELPAPGTVLRSCYASHAAVDGDDPAVFAALLRALYNHAAGRGYRQLIAGFAAGDPLGRAVRGYRAFRYASQLYLAAWEDGETAVAEAFPAEGRLPAPEVALL